MLSAPRLSTSIRGSALLSIVIMMIAGSASTMPVTTVVSHAPFSSRQGGATNLARKPPTNATSSASTEEIPAPPDAQGKRSKTKSARNPPGEKKPTNEENEPADPAKAQGTAGTLDEVDGTNSDEDEVLEEKKSEPEEKPPTEDRAPPPRTKGTSAPTTTASDSKDEPMVETAPKPEQPSEDENSAEPLVPKPENTKEIPDDSDPEYSDLRKNMTTTMGIHVGSAATIGAVAVLAAVVGGMFVVCSNRQSANASESQPYQPVAQNPFTVNDEIDADGWNDGWQEEEEWEIQPEPAKT